MSATRLLIYGAYGYTGELIARQAVADGLAPILAGRNAERLDALAGELELVSRPFELTDHEAAASALADIDVVLHCAGPFSQTSAPMIDACLASATHYLDITGEIAVFEQAFARTREAEAAGIVLCPGAGFDVVPTDCVAARLAEALPDATELALGFDSRSGLSPGTAKTSVEALGDGGKVRRRGRIETVPLAADVRQIDFGDGEKTAMTIPWGDVATAYHSTGIQNIAVYLPMSPKRIKQIRRLNALRPLLRLSVVTSFLKRRAGRIQGPDADTRRQQPTYVWGEARNAAGERRTARLRVANGYDVTVHASLALARRLLANEHGDKRGTFTPSLLAGWAFVESLPGSEAIHVEPAAVR